jgi:hypothetical protein
VAIPRRHRTKVALIETATLITLPLRERFEASSDSQHAADLAEPKAFGWVGHQARFGAAYAGVMADAVAGHLLVLAAGVDPDVEVGLALLAPARSAAEAASRCWWLVDPEITAQQRLHRAMTLRIQGLRNTANLEKEFGEACRGGADAKVARAFAQADALGLKIERSPKDGAPIQLQPGPGKSGPLLKECLESSGLELGANIWDLWSAVVHTYPPTLINYFRTVHRQPTSDVLGELTIGATEMDLEDAALISIEAAMAMAERHWQYIGFPRDRLDHHRRTVRAFFQEDGQH